MKKIILLLLMFSFLLVGCEMSKSSGDKNNTNFVITEEILDGKEFAIDSELDENDMMDCNWFFAYGIVYYYDSFEMAYTGTYTIQDDKILVKLDTFFGPYSPEQQKIDIDVTLRMPNETTIVVDETPASFKLKTSTPTEDGWEFDGGEKDFTFEGLVKDYKYYIVPVVEKLNNEADWVEPADYKKNVKAESYTVADVQYFADSILVPHINIDSDYAKNANTEIKKAFDIVVAHYNQGVEDKMSYVDSCNYMTYDSGKKLSVLFWYGLGATDVVHPVYYTYNFNLEDGSRMTFDEFCEYIGNSTVVIESSAEDRIKEYLNTEMASFDETEREKYTNLTIESFKNSISSNNIRYGINVEGTPFVIVDIQLPAGTGHFDTIIELY